MRRNFVVVSESLSSNLQIYENDYPDTMNNVLLTPADRYFSIDARTGNLALNYYYGSTDLERKVLPKVD